MPGDIFIAKVFRQRNSLVVVIPRPVCIALELKAGQYMVFKWQNSEGQFEFKKLIPAGAKDGQDTRGPNSGDPGGGK